ncbi:hypothetical protein B0H10DRAFT_1675427, partial [Mycena sp. CBHHK59/15]
IDFIPRVFDVFGTWGRIAFKLPTIPEVGARHSSNVVRATAPILGSAVQCITPEPAHLNFALIRTGEAKTLMAGTTVEGLRVAQVKVLFKLPDHYPVKASTTPLAYIEWFTPLRNPDPLDGYYHLSRSTRQQAPYAEIITADRIVRNVMLIP